jgi:hypothetical protein
MTIADDARLIYDHLAGPLRGSANGPAVNALHRLEAAASKGEADPDLDVESLVETVSAEAKRRRRAAKVAADDAQRACERSARTAEDVPYRDRINVDKRGEN